jgi:hypothetical protein
MAVPSIGRPELGNQEDFQPSGAKRHIVFLVILAFDMASKKEEPNPCGRGSKTISSLDTRAKAG